MIQAIVTYSIVAIAIAWLIWTLFLPPSLHARLRPGNKATLNRSEGCHSCSGCPASEAQPKCPATANHGPEHH